jgi:hypothetical protein
MGFDGLFFGRIDYQDRVPRTAETKLEMVWKASANLGGCPIRYKSSEFHIEIFVDRQSWLFTGVLPTGYGAPPSFCFDTMTCSNPPIMVCIIIYQFSVH